LSQTLKHHHTNILQADKGTDDDEDMSLEEQHEEQIRPYKRLRPSPEVIHIEPEASPATETSDQKKRNRKAKTNNRSKLVRGATAVLGLGMMAANQFTGTSSVPS